MEADLTFLVSTDGATPRPSRKKVAIPDLRGPHGRTGRAQTMRQSHSGLRWHSETDELLFERASAALSFGAFCAVGPAFPENSEVMVDHAVPAAHRSWPLRFTGKGLEGRIALLRSSHELGRGAGRGPGGEGHAGRIRRRHPMTRMP